MAKPSLAVLLAGTILTGASLPAHAADEIRYAGALTFSPDGVLFVGDNVSNAVFAYALGKGAEPTADPTLAPLEVDNINVRVAAALGVSPGEVTINGMAVHPVSREVYLSVSRGVGTAALPAVLKVSAAGGLANVDLGVHQVGEYVINDAPGANSRFRDRSHDWPVPAPAKYDAKAQTPMSSMTIVDMKFHEGELYISGISNEAFASTLRRVPFPFAGKQAETQVRIYHVAHSRYETRAPIRAMEFATIDGQDTLVAGYTCSPLVLIPVASLKDGAKVTGRTIGDMGNGQPLSMVSFSFEGKPSLFVTNMAHSPRIIPLSGLQNAVEYTPTHVPQGGYPDDTSPDYPLGPVGKGVLFVGASLHADLLNAKYFVSLTRDSQSGSLNLESLPTAPLPMKLDKIWSEYDFPGGGKNSD